MSSRTSSSLGSKMLFPSRRQRTLCAATRVSWSTVRLLRSCCTVPMMVLAITTPKKVMFAKDPTNARQSASTIKTRLKNVKILSRMISVSLRVGEAAAWLSSPAAMRWAALFRGQALGWVCFQQRHLRAFGLWLGRGRLLACRARQL